MGYEGSLIGNQPERKKVVDWSALRTNEALEQAMTAVMQEIVLSEEELRTLSGEEIQEHYQQNIKDKGYPYGFRINVDEFGPEHPKRVRGFSSSPFDKGVIFF